MRSVSTRWRRLPLMLAPLLPGCLLTDLETSGDDVVDLDQDGYLASEDCSDVDRNVYPGATEFPDGKDNDCDGRIDESTEVSDDDGDGYSEQAGDCDDGNPAVYPGAADLADGDSYDTQLDNDCDGQVNEDEKPEVDFEDPDDLQGNDASEARAIFYQPEALIPAESAYMESARWVGDLDGDGHDDLAVANLQGDGQGRVYLFYGLEGGLEGSQAYEAAADAILYGVDSPNFVGTILRGGRDINGDGHPELLVGDSVQRTVAVFFGGRRLSGDYTLEDADVVIRAGEDGAFTVGPWVDWTDVDGDGFTDLLIGQPSYDYWRGRVLLFYGAPGMSGHLDLVDADASFEGVGCGDIAGYSVAAMGDLDQDGYGDFLIGAPWELVQAAEDTDGDGETDTDAIYGRTYLFPGRADGYHGSRAVTDAPATLVPDHGVWTSSLSVAQGDFDGDGADDLALALPDDRDGLGILYLTYGGIAFPQGEQSYTAFGDTAFIGLTDLDVNFGASLDFGDVDGDGRDELAASIPWTRDEVDGAYEGVGYVVLFGGRTDRPLEVGEDGVLTVVNGAYGVIETLWSVSLGGDNQGDGRADLVLGTEYYPYDLPANATLLFEGGSF